MADRSSDEIDPEHPRDGDPFDAADHFTGEDYHRDREAALGRQRPSGSQDAIATCGDPAHPGGRAHFDPQTGEVHERGLAEDETDKAGGETH